MKYPAQWINRGNVPGLHKWSSNKTKLPPLGDGNLEHLKGTEKTPFNQR